MQINVTRKDILLGRRNDPYWCPIARAIMRAGIADVSVDGVDVTMFDDDGLRFDVELPVAAQEFVEYFDKHYLGHFTMKPFSFELPLVEAAA